MKEKLYNLIKGQIKDKNTILNDNMDFKNDLGINSLLMVDLIVSIEDEFKISILDKDIPKLNTVQSLYEYVRNLIR